MRSFSVRDEILIDLHYAAVFPACGAFGLYRPLARLGICRGESAGTKIGLYFLQVGGGKIELEFRIINTLFQGPQGLKGKGTLIIH